ncbi:MAG: DUF2066 domain-containing protein [Hydrocarboniphaga effusa]|nr:DUF2066 domain-containing protein [Hydrocarboniphaga effusa]
MRKNSVSALALVLALAAFPSLAAPVRGLYEARVPVADQSPQLREPALQQAFEAVLVRVTGNRSLPATEAATVLARAGKLVQGYGYETSADGQGLQLKAQFDARAVDALLRQQGLPVWGPNRLSHQLWIALRDDGQPRALLDAASAPQRAAAALVAAEARGVPLSFPVMDATDRQLATFNEVWSGNTEGVQGAARRVNADRVLIGRVGRESGRWQARWTLLDTAGLSEEWNGTYGSAEEALAEGIHQPADREARRFATQPGRDQELRLQISNITSLQDYGRALSYLRALNPVRAAQIEAVQDNLVTFRLSVEGDPESLARVIAAGSVLRKEDGLFNSGNRYVLVR